MAMHRIVPEEVTVIVVLAVFAATFLAWVAIFGT
jgi:hypothetical protein